MKVNRTYTMELRTLELLARKKNKSLIVNTSIRHYFNHEDQFNPADLPTRQLLAIIHNREDVPEHLKLLINLHLTQ